jgi:hypothetical protein
MFPAQLAPTQEIRCPVCQSLFLTIGFTRKRTIAVVDGLPLESWGMLNPVFRMLVADYMYQQWLETDKMIKLPSKQIRVTTHQRLLYDVPTIVA